MARLGSFRADDDSRLVYVFDDALIEMRPSTISSLPDWLLRPGLLGDTEGRSLDKREASVLSFRAETSSQEIAQRFKWAERTAFADIEGVELHHGGRIRTACELTIDTTDGSTANLFVKADEAEYVRDLLARALGSRFQSDLGSSVSA